MLALMRGPVRIFVFGPPWNKFGHSCDFVTLIKLPLHQRAYLQLTYQKQRGRISLSSHAMQGSKWLMEQ